MIGPTAFTAGAPLASTTKPRAAAPLGAVEFSGQKKPAAQKPVGPTTATSPVTGSTRGALPLPAAQKKPAGQGCGASTPAGHSCPAGHGAGALLVLAGGQKAPAAQGPEQLRFLSWKLAAKRPAGQGCPQGSLWSQ